MERFAERKYGETKLWFAEPGVEEGPADATEADPEVEAERDS